MNINEVTIAGNLTRDPELRYSPKGTAIAKVGVAVNRSWKTDSGEKKEEVTFIDVDFFGSTAESVAKYFTKGRPIYIRGRLKLEQWDDKQTGQKRSRVGVSGDHFQFVDGKPQESNAGKVTSERAREELQKLKAATAPDAEPENQDVPF